MYKLLQRYEVARTVFFFPSKGPINKAYIYKVVYIVNTASKYHTLILFTSRNLILNS